MTTKQLLDRIAAEFPEYWAWVQAKPNALKKLRALAQEIASNGWGVARSVSTMALQLRDLKSFQTFSSQGPGAEDEPPPAEGGEGGEVDTEETTSAPVEEPGIDEDARDLLANFLTENELPSSLMSFITNALSQNWSFARIVADLRQTPEYKAAYPEMELRRQNGWDPISEAEVRGYRSEARRLAMEYFGATLTNEDIAQILGVKNKSIREYEVDLQTYKEVERWGPGVKMVLASELGYEPDDELIFRLLHAEIPTPELQRAYRRSLMRGQPASIGLGIRPEEEATVLEQLGIDPVAAFRGYQGIVAETPRAERLAMIEAEINRGIDRFPSLGQMTGMPAEPGVPGLGDTTFMTLFAATFYQDPEAIRRIQSQIAREVARWQAGGGAAQSGSGAAVGLLTAGERAQG